MYVVAILLLNIMEVFSVCGWALLDRQLYDLPNNGTLAPALPGYGILARTDDDQTQ